MQLLYSNMTKKKP